MNPDYRRRGWIDPIIALLLCMSAFVLYRLTLSAGAFPGISADIIVRQVGLLPRLTADTPLWGALARMIAGQGPGIADRLNLFSAACGAACVGLLYQIMSSAVYYMINVIKDNHIRAAVASRLAGLAAAGFLMFCIPFWVVATRAHSLTFGILLLLSVTGILLIYLNTGRLWVAMLFAFLYGIGTVEFATFIPFAILFGPFLLLMLWRNEALSPRVVMGLLASAMLGLSLYLVAAWSFSSGEGYSLRDFSSPLQVVWIMWRDQVFVLTRSLPQRGWLIVLVVTTVPWLAALFVAHRALNEERDWAFYILHIILSAVVVLMALNVKNISPWRMLGFGRLLVTPYVLSASLFGYLVAYWLLTPSCWWPEDVDEAAWIPWARKWLGLLFVLPALALVGATAFRNLPEADGRNAGFINSYAREMVGGLCGRSWIVTAGIMDNHLLLAGRDLDIPVRTLNLAGESDELYMRYIARQFDDPALKNLTQVGTYTLLQEWLEDYPDADQQLALFQEPDILVGAGKQVVPHKALFMATSQVNAESILKRYDENCTFWEESILGAMAGLATNGTIGAYNNYLLQRTSIAANNYGVLMEDIAEPDKAFHAYLQARKIFPQNISALLNMRAMLVAGHPTEEKDTVNGWWETFVKQQSRLNLWGLSRSYGYVRSPQAFVDSGFVWAQSGRRGMAVAGIKKALDLLPEGEQTSLKTTLGMVYLRQQENEKSEAVLEEILQQQPEQQTALIGLARLATRKGDFAKTKSLLARALKAGVPKPIVSLEWARANLLAGKEDLARVLLESVIEAQPNFIDAHILLADMFFRNGNKKELQACMERMQALPKSRDFLLFMKGQIALRENDLAAARDNFESARSFKPRNTLLLELLLRLDVVERKSDQAKRHAIALLRLDPDNAIANHVMGSFHLEAREYDRAESLLRKSLKTRRNYETLNDLAWTLQAMDRLEEAEALAREAIAMAAAMPHAHDTLGTILMKRNQLPDALAAFERYRSLRPQDPMGKLHAAQVLVKMNDLDRAQTLIDEISTQDSLLTPEQQETLAELRTKL